MGDLFFEEELRRRIKKGEYDRLDEYCDRTFENVKNGSYYDYSDLLSRFEPIIELYIRDKYCDGLDIDQLQVDDDERFDRYYDIFSVHFDKFDEFFDKSTLAAFAKRCTLTEEDRDYIKLGISEDFIDGYKSIIPVLFRKQVFDFFGNDFLQVLQELNSKYPEEFKRFRINTAYFEKMFSDKPYGEKLQEELDESVEKTVEHRFNDRINCGGYALKVDRCVFPFYHADNFPKLVTGVLETFPYTRLLGDTALGDDEYLVFYRGHGGKNPGHHFIRVDSDGTVREKDGAGKPQIFEAWYEGFPQENQAIFAVKKDHPMFDIERLDTKKIYDFEGRVGMAIEQKENDFDYHGHKFRLKKGEDGEIIVIDDKGEFVADVVAEDGQCFVEVSKEKQDYVENFHGKVKPIIENGKLVNYDEVAGIKRVVEDGER